MDNVCVTKILAILTVISVTIDKGIAIDLTARITKPTCVDIPTDITLCHGIGYSQMRMPNLLEHDTMAEVKYQARSWIPLILKKCHPDTQLFLCALFTPVCVDRLIYPCRSLCEMVKSGCEPVMQVNCFPWPEMLDCDNFPENDLCIKSEMRGGNSTEEVEIRGGIANSVGLFTQCHDNSEADTLREYFCTADFVLKMKFTSVKNVKEVRRFQGNTERFEVYKRGSMRDKDLKKLVFYVREGTNCGCDILEAGRDFYLVMGHREGKKLYMTFVHTWHKTKAFRSVIRRFEDTSMECAVTLSPVEAPIETVDTYSENPTDSVRGGSERPPRHGQEGSSDDPTDPPRVKDKKPRLTKEERRAIRKQMRKEEERLMREQQELLREGAADNTEAPPL